jgi:hypothetical protein
MLDSCYFFIIISYYNFIIIGDKYMDKQLLEELKSQVKNNKIPCKKALELANKYDVKPAVLGKKLNELKIKVKGCQLGCF